MFQGFVRSWELRRTTGSTFRALLTQLGRTQIRQRRTRSLFGMTEKCQSAFERLKKALVSAPVLVYPIREGKFVLDTDASATAIQWRSPVTDSKRERESHCLWPTLQHAKGDERFTVLFSFLFFFNDKQELTDERGNLFSIGMMTYIYIYPLINRRAAI